MSEAYGRSLVNEDTSAYESVCAIVAGLSFLLFALGLTTLVQVTNLRTTLLGFDLLTLLGIGLSVAGVGVVAFGVGSRAGFGETTPSDTSGIPAAVVFGLIAFVAGGLIGSQTFGLSLVGWLVLAVVLAAGTTAFVLFVPEDVSSTVPAGVFAAGIGALLVSGVIGLGWSWNPTDFSATFNPPVVVPGLVALSSLLVAWTAAKAYGGFGSRGRQNGAYLLIGLNALAMIAILFMIVALVVSKGWGMLVKGVQIGPGLNFFWPFVMNVSDGIYIEIPGVLPAIMGTVWLVIGSVIFAVPLGVGAAVFLTEYAEQGAFTRLVEVTTNGLWSTPSIVFGLFGYAFLVPRFGNSSSLLAGIFVLGFMLLPLVLITSREALQSVPNEYRDASAALGVSQWETIRSVVLPAAMPGVITGVILGVGRIAGETAPLILVLANTPFPSTTPQVLSSFEFSTTAPFVTNSALLQPASALPYQIYAAITAGVGVGDTQAFGWGTALVLLLVVLSFYAVGIASRNYFRKRLNYE